MIHVRLGSLIVSGNTPADLERMLGHLGAPVTEKEMAALGGVSISTIKRWKLDPDFPRTESGTINRRDFLSYLFRSNQTKSDQ